MSASEKLKALTTFDLTVDTVGEVRLYAVPLPQIVAVVEKLERWKTVSLDIHGAHLIPEATDELWAALTELEEALS